MKVASTVGFLLRTLGALGFCVGLLFVLSAFAIPSNGHYYLHTPSLIVGICMAVLSACAIFVGRGIQTQRSPKDAKESHDA
jgi:hypothetical protein